MVKGAKKRGKRGSRGPSTVAAREAVDRAAQLLDTRQGRRRTIVREAIDAPVMPALEYEIISDRRVSLGIKKATEYVDLPTFSGERSVGENHVQKLFDEMERGHFNATNVTLASAELDGAVYKVNGQHTCWSVVYMQDVTPGYELPNVREIKYRVESSAQLKALYSSFDRAMGRTDSHITKVVLVDAPEIAGVPPSIIQRITPGLKFWLAASQHERQRYTPPVVAGLVLQKYPELFKKVGKFYQTNFAPHIKRASVIGATFATFDKVASVAPDFWIPVATGLDLTSRTDPRYRLREFLQNVVVAATAGKIKRVVDAESMYRVCIGCWNKWRADEIMLGVPRASKERVKPK